MNREQRYVVFKISDVLALSIEDRQEILRIGEKLESIRAQAGKKPLDCVVIESDWPEYEPVWRAILER